MKSATTACGQVGTPLSAAEKMPETASTMLCGRHQISEPQRRKQRFGKGADIDHPAIGIDALERGKRLIAEIEIAVVIILDDKGIGGLGGIEKASRRDRLSTRLKGC
jgi:hypothetical protein